MSLQEQIRELARRSRAASRRTAELSTREKDAWLLRAAERLEAGEAQIREANARDLREARDKGVADPLLGRLELSDFKWRDTLAGLREIARSSFSPPPRSRPTPSSRISAPPWVSRLRTREGGSGPSLTTTRPPTTASRPSPS